MARTGCFRRFGICRRRLRWRCRTKKRSVSATMSRSSRRFGASLSKRAPGEAKTEEELDLAVRQIVSRAVAPEGVMDIFAAAGLPKPDISILSDEFLAEVQGMPQRNLAVELLRKLLSGEIRMRRRKNVVQARSFAEMLEQNRFVATKTERSKPRR
ncbi:MAG: DUF3387 domain-containing protein [Candidatus Manganitrophus sp.]|nr:DUF3387 domain-containing protein [Candidatus Manganitrophus sp.]